MAAQQVFDPIALVATELQLPPAGVRAVSRLVDEGNTVPFIARYRKEATGSLDEVQIRNVQDRMGYLRELDERRQAILASIEEQGKLTEELKSQIVACTTKAVLEDLYLPYKPKRRTRATVARERGLEPLAQLILGQPGEGDPAEAAAPFIDAEKEVADPQAALAGARDIVAEQVAEQADVRAFVRKTFQEHAFLVSGPARDKPETKTKYDQYYEFREPVAKIPSHRFLAIRRGEREKVLKVQLELDESTHPIVPRVLAKAGHQPESPFSGQLAQAVEDGLRRLVIPSVETDVRVELKLGSDREAVEVFANNLRDLLLASPLGARTVMGIDPGIRTGCKCAVVDGTGKFAAHTTIYPLGKKASEEAATQLVAFCKEHQPFAIAVGNGTGGRETEHFVRQALKAAEYTEPVVVSVNEAGASVYSASPLAREEFPDLDVTVRGAVSIARRLQDPLAELVKIDPKSIGVGQYQHDVQQTLLKRKLDEVVESCVNHVGVELNTASAPLLSYVSGIGPALARRLVEARDANGAFTNRQALLEVNGLGPRKFQQAAGFLRVNGSPHPLDNSAVHPERYELVAKMAADLGVPLSELVGNEQLVSQIVVANYVSDEVGEPTLQDILSELRKPTRDPRDAFEAPAFRDDVLTLDDLEKKMQLEGVVTNVTNFGVFVDVGVKQDGLVHISELAERYVEDPHEVVQVGQKLTVWVLEVDTERKRISLTARRDRAEGKPAKRRSRSRKRKKKAPVGTPLAELKVGEVVQGKVTSIAKFGVFVNIGARSDGLVHISRLSEGYVEDPNEVVSIGQELKVRILEVDLERKRISLTAQTEEAAAGAPTEDQARGGRGGGRQGGRRPDAGRNRGGQGGGGRGGQGGGGRGRSDRDRGGRGRKREGGRKDDAAPRTITSGENKGYRPFEVLLDRFGTNESSDE